MSKQPTLNDIYLTVGEIKGEVKGINCRLDKLNGTVCRHEDRINNNESAIDQQKGKSIAYGVISATIISAIGLLFSWIKLK
jgi:hypothetical protein